MEFSQSGPNLADVGWVRLGAGVRGEGERPEESADSGSIPGANQLQSKISFHEGDQPGLVLGKSEQKCVSIFLKTLAHIPFAIIRVVKARVNVSPNLRKEEEIRASLASRTKRSHGEHSPYRRGTK